MNTILNFWFPNTTYQKFWFDKTKDHYIIKNYSSLLNETNNKIINFDKSSNEDLLIYIIILDQFSRHIYRNKERDENFKIMNDKALNLSLYFINNRNLNNTPLHYLIFYLMPLRHSKKIDNYNILIKILYNFKQNNEIYDIKLFEKFYKATIRDLNNILMTF